MKLIMARKKKMLALKAEPYERLRALSKELGWPKNWLAHEIDRLIRGLLIVAEQAKKDAEELEELSEEQVKQRAEDLMRRYMES